MGEGLHSCKGHAMGCKAWFAMAQLAKASCSGVNTWTSVWGLGRPLL